jgi:hypothetical protein
MEKKKEFYVNIAMESRENELPVPKAKDRAVCICCKRPLRTRINGQFWNPETHRYEITPESRWMYIGHAYFCTQRCGIIYGTMAADKKLKVNIKG